jgi:uncharacterized protein YkwD
MRHYTVCMCIALAGFAFAATPGKTPRATKTTFRDKVTSATVERNKPQRIDPAKLDAELVARQIFEKTNEERRKAGLGEFSWMSELAMAANAHSADMAGKQYFSHNGKGFLRRSSVSSRAEQAGVGKRMLAENIAMIPTFRSQQTRTVVDKAGNYSQQWEVAGDTYSELTDWALEQWMNSPGHRKNILNPELTRLGVGVAIGDNKGVPYVYLTQDFAGE